MRAGLAGVIEHTLLKPEATEQQILTLCEEALRYSFHSVCVNPVYVRLCSGRLHGSSVRVTTVAGFPLGATLSASKALEARESVASGASDIDMVMQLGAAKAGAWDIVRRDIQAVRDSIPDAVLKVIIEACLLDDDEKQRAAEAAILAGADFIKTSTGFSSGGATPADVRLIRSVAAGRARIKAAGGIKTLASLMEMLDAGANLIGTSSGVSICGSG